MERTRHQSRWQDRAARRVDEALEKIHVTPEADRPPGTCSRGMKQRVGIGQTILNDPELLIVDEPTPGLEHVRVCQQDQAQVLWPADT